MNTIGKGIDLRLSSESYIDRSNVINLYLNDIRKYPVLTHSEEIELVNRYKQGDEDAFDKLILCNQRFVFAIAKRYARDEKLPDLINEGNLGLINAIKNFDPDRDFRFLTYAVWHIRAKINMYLTLNDSIVLKSNKNRTRFFDNKIKNKFYCQNGRFPTPEEMLEIFEKEYGIKINDKTYLYDIKTTSINTTFDDDDSNAFENSSAFTSITASYNDVEKKIEQESTSNDAHYALNCLKERDREIVKLSFGIDCDKEYTNQEIGDMYNMTAERIRQIIKHSTAKMKLALKQRYR